MAFVPHVQYLNGTPNDDPLTVLMATWSDVDECWPISNMYQPSEAMVTRDPSDEPSDLQVPLQLPYPGSQGWYGIGAHEAFDSLDGPEDPWNMMRVSLNSHTTPLKRESACIECADAGTKCLGRPHCDLCVKDTKITPLPRCIADSPLVLLNILAWFSSCQALGLCSRGSTAQRNCVHPWRQTCCKVILELDFEDLEVRRSISKTHTVSCDLHHRAPPSDNPIATPPPHISIPQFDQLVLAMWRPKCKFRKPMKNPTKKSTKAPVNKVPEATSAADRAEGEDGAAQDPEIPNTDQLSASERELFVRAQLVVGYYSLLRNFDLIRVNDAEWGGVDGHWVLADLTYLLAYRFSDLMYQISSQYPRISDECFRGYSFQSAEVPQPDVRPFIRFSVVEIIYRGIKTAGPPEWNLGPGAEFSELNNLAEQLEHTYQHIVQTLRLCECAFSALLPKARPPTLPGEVVMLREAARSGLPKNLVVAILPLDRLLFRGDPFPLLATGPGWYSIIDVFALRGSVLTDAVLDSENPWIPRPRLPQYAVAEDNTIRDRQGLEKVGYQSQSERQKHGNGTHVSTGYATATGFTELSFLRLHPDPPNSGYPPSVLASIGLHLNEVTTDHAEESQLSTDLDTADLLAPKSFYPDFHDPHGPEKADIRSWDARPISQSKRPRKRKRSEDDDETTAPSESDTESTQLKKMINACNYNPPGYDLFFAESIARLLKATNYEITPAP
jgi:hypothetical protein